MNDLLPQPDDTIAFWGHELKVYHQPMPSMEVLEALHNQGIYAAVWSWWTEDSDEGDLFESLLNDHCTGRADYEKYTPEQALEAFCLNADLTPAKNAIQYEIRWTENVEDLYAPFQEAQLASVEAQSAGLGFTLIPCTASENVVPAGYLAHIFDMWEKRFGMHFVAFGDYEEPEVVIRFPHPGDNEQAILDSVNTVGDEILCYREPSGALQIQLWWD